MHSKTLFFKWISTCFLICSLILFSFPTSLFAADSGEVTILNVNYPTTTLSKGDKFNLSFEFYSSSDLTSIKSVSASGEAINSSGASYTILSGEKPIEGPTTISAGTILTVEYSGLTYTGTGTEGTVSVSAGNGSASYPFDLKTLSTQDVQGALILDGSTTNNLSMSMNAGESKKFSLQVKNATSETIKNGVAKVYFEDTTVGLNITSGQYTNLSSLNSGSTRSLSFSVAADTSVKSGKYTLIVELNSVKQKVYLSIDSGISPPIIELSISEKASFSLGEINPLTIYVSNTGGKSAKNIKVEIQNEADLAVIGSSNVKNISSLAAGSKTSYSSNIQLDSSTSSSLLRLKLGLTYNDEAGEAYSDTQYIYLNTNTVNQTNELSITSVKGPSGTHVTNQNFNVDFKLTSTYGAENVKVTVKPAENIIAKSQNVFVLSELAKGKSKDYSVTFAATDAIATGTYPIQILLEYDYQGKAFTMSQYTSVSISNEEDDSKTNPKVILSECMASPQVVKAGENVTINFTFLNTHPSKTVYNLTATLDFNTNNNDEESTTSATSLFKTVSSSNTLFASTLAPGASSAQSIIIGTSASATAATYDVSVQLSYQDEKGSEITSTETIPITISQDVNIDVAQIDLGTLSIGRSSALTATLYNISKSSITNVMMYLESDALDTGFSVTDNKYYLSSFEMGGTEYYAPNLTGMKAGTYKVNLVIEYEDCLGNPQVTRYPFEVEVGGNNAPNGFDKGANGANPMKQGKGNMPPMQNNSSMNPWLMGGIVVGLAVVVFIAYRHLKKRKQTKDINLNE